jgi:hypothetical protein
MKHPTPNNKLVQTLHLPYFIEYSAHFFTLKRMLKYSPCTIHWELLRNGLRWLLWWINFQRLILVKLFLKNNFFLPKIIVKFRCALYLYALYLIKYSILGSSQLTPNTLCEIAHRVRVGQIFEFAKLILFLKMYLGTGLTPTSQTVGPLIFPFLLFADHFSSHLCRPGRNNMGLLFS